MRQSIGGSERSGVVVGWGGDAPAALSAEGEQLWKVHYHDFDEEDYNLSMVSRACPGTRRRRRRRRASTGALAQLTLSLN
eukprot:COSAG01_NODE_1192_length_11309_cov_8.575609_18_plen_80_part_00